MHTGDCVYIVRLVIFKVDSSQCILRKEKKLEKQTEIYPSAPCVGENICAATLPPPPPSLPLSILPHLLPLSVLLSVLISVVLGFVWPSVALCCQQSQNLLHLTIGLYVLNVVEF